MSNHHARRGLARRLSHLAEKKTRCAYNKGEHSLYFNHYAHEPAALPRLRFARAGANANAASGRGEMVDAADFNWSARGETAA